MRKSKNYLIYENEIDEDFTSLMYAMYMKGEWGVEVGYKIVPLNYATTRKRILDYQLLASVDCHNEYFTASQGKPVYNCCSSGSTLSPNTGLCTDAFGNVSSFLKCSYVVPNSILISAPVGNNETIGNTYCIPTPIPVVIENIINVIPPLSIEQFIVGNIGGPVNGTTVFTASYLIGKTTIEVAQLMVLTLGVDYTFNNTSGTITLLQGRTFNTGEVYTITTF